MKKQTAARTQSLNITDRVIMLAIDFKKIGNTRRLPNSKFSVDAEAKMVRASKKLLDSPELQAISKFDSQVRDYIASRALPSMFKGGFWMMPNGLIEEVDMQLDSMAAARTKLVEDFVFAYENLKKAAVLSLRSIYNEADYMTKEQVRAHFAITWRYITFGVPEQLAQIKKQVYEREQKKAAEHLLGVTHEIKNMLRTNMADLVGHMVDRLTPGEDGKAKVFHSTMMEKVLDFLNTFSDRNVTDDNELKTLVDKAKKLVGGVDHAKLKKDADARETMAKGFQQIKDTLDKLVIAKPKRKLRLGTEPAASSDQTLPLPMEGDGKAGK